MGDLLEGVTLEHQKLCTECGMSMGPTSSGLGTSSQQDPPSSSTSSTSHQTAGGPSGREDGSAKQRAGEDRGSHHHGSRGHKQPASKGEAKGSNGNGNGNGNGSRMGNNPSSYDYYYDQEPMSAESIRKVRAFELATIRKILDALSLEHPFYSVMILKPLIDFLGIKDPSFSSPSSPFALLEQQLDKLDCDKIGRCCEWLTEKV